HDLRPEFEILGVGTTGIVGPPGRVLHGEPWYLRDAGLDRIDQAEVAHEPGEGLALRVAAPLDVERRGRQVDGHGDAGPSIAQAVVDPVEPLEPHTGLDGFVFEFGPLLGCDDDLGLLAAPGRYDISLRSRIGGLGTPAVMPLVVEYHDRQAVIQIA